MSLSVPAYRYRDIAHVSYLSPMQQTSSSGQGYIGKAQIACEISRSRSLLFVARGATVRSGKIFILIRFSAVLFKTSIRNGLERFTDTQTLQVPAATFQEWPLRDAVLKRAVMNGVATFQVQFTWDPCINRDHKADAAMSLQSNALVRSHLATERRIVVRTA